MQAIACALAFTIFSSLVQPEALAEPTLRHSRLAAADWRVNAAPNLVDHPPSQAEVEKFVEAVEIAVTGQSGVGKENDGYICGFRFADLRHDGFLSLIAVSGVIDRPGCSDVDVIDRTPSGFELFGAISHTQDGETLRTDIRDLRGDGRNQFLTHADLSEIPRQCIATWTSIFAWTGASYTNVSSQFKDFYRERLDTIDRVIPRLQADRGSDCYSLDDKECLLAEAGAIQRLLGVPADAGLDQAIGMAGSSKDTERYVAIELLAEIGTPKARKYLEKLAEDKNSGLAHDARYNLSISRDGPKEIVSSSINREGSVKY